MVDSNGFLIKCGVVLVSTGFLQLEKLSVGGSRKNPNLNLNADDNYALAAA